MATSRTQRLWIVLGGLGLVVVAAVAVLLIAIGGGDDAAAPTAKDGARAYLSAWQGQRWRALRGLTVGGSAAAPAAYQAQLKDLGADRVRARLVSGHGNAKAWSGTFRAALHVPDAGSIVYEGTLALAPKRGGWKVVWSPATVHPKLPADGSFGVERAFQPRAPILGVDSTPLTVNEPVVDVGLVPERITNRTGIEAALQRTLGVSPADVEAKLTAPGVQPNYFVLIATVPAARYEEVDAEIYPLPGTAFRRRTSRGAVTPQLGAHVIGRTGPVTAEILKELGPSYEASDTVGLSGLERKYEARLAGAPGRRFVVRDGQGTTVDTLKDVPGQPGQPVRTTIDLRTQQAAEAALADTAPPAAFVALQPSTGELRAIVSTPIEEEFNRALDGRYPPGSTFKIVTTAALLANGTTPATETTCPTTFTVDGRAFRNFEGEVQPSLSFSRAFEISCNTAFLQLAREAARRRAGPSGDEHGLRREAGSPARCVGWLVPRAGGCDRTRRVRDRSGQGDGQPARDGCGRRCGRCGGVEPVHAGARSSGPTRGAAAPARPGDRIVAARADGERGHQRDRYRSCGERTRRGGEDGDGRVRRRREPTDARLVRRVLGRPRVRRRR